MKSQSKKMATVILLFTAFAFVGCSGGGTTDISVTGVTLNKGEHHNLSGQYRTA